MQKGEMGVQAKSGAVQAVELVHVRDVAPVDSYPALQPGASPTLAPNERGWLEASTPFVGELIIGQKSAIRKQLGAGSVNTPGATQTVANEPDR